MTWESVVGIIGFLVSITTLAGVAVFIGRLLQRVDTMEKVIEKHEIEIKDANIGITGIREILIEVKTVLTGQTAGFAELKQTVQKHVDEGRG